MKIFSLHCFCQAFCPCNRKLINTEKMTALASKEKFWKLHQRLTKTTYTSGGKLMACVVQWAVSTKALMACTKYTILHFNLLTSALGKSVCWSPGSWRTREKHGADQGPSYQAKIILDRLAASCGNACKMLLPGKVDLIPRVLQLLTYP